MRMDNSSTFSPSNNETSGDYSGSQQPQHPQDEEASTVTSRSGAVILDDATQRETFAMNDDHDDDNDYSAYDNSTIGSIKPGVADHHDVVKGPRESSSLRGSLVVPLSAGSARASFSTSTTRTTEGGKFKTYQPSQRAVNSLDDFTINKLNFSKLDLYGREEEKAVLRQVLSNMMEKRQKQLVLISGNSGTGKSALAKDICRVPELRQEKGMLVKGKFDWKSKEPYEGIAAACTNVVSQLLALATRDATRFATIQQSLHGDELSILAPVIPVLSEIYPDIHQQELLPPKCAATTEVNLHSSEAKNRFDHAFRRFIRVISQHFKPFVFILDDLQWADVPSLAMLENMLMDHDNNNLLLIGIYRSNEIDERHRLTHTLHDLQARSSPSCRSNNPSESQAFDITKIELGNLEFDAVHSLIMDLLGTSDSRTLGLADICIRRTNGNVFFLLHFLQELHHRCLLEFRLSTLEWQWNDAEIERQTKATDNVVDLLRSKMSKLPPKQNQVLQLASFLGASFHKDTLDILWSDFSEEDKTTQSETSFEAEGKDPLADLATEGFIQTLDGSEYQFAHDKVQEAASSLVPEMIRGDLSRSIGNSLAAKLAPEQFESSVFVATHLLNTGKAPDTDCDRIKLAHLNLRASRKAISVSAFDAAAGFASKGIELVGSNGWKDNYELTLELYTLGTETESYLGNIELMEEYYYAIMAQKDRPKEDKLKAQAIYLNSLAKRGGATKAVKLSLDVLRSHGHKFPTTKVGVLVNFLRNVAKIKKLLKTKELYRFPSLPKDTDPTRMKLLHILDQLLTFVYISEDPSLFPVLVMRMLDWTRRYGLNCFSSSVLSHVGIIFAGVLGDIAGGAEFGSVALEIAQNNKFSQPTEARCMFLANGLVLHWKQPFQHSLKGLLEAYDLGLRTGDTESACWAIDIYTVNRFLLGTNLALMVRDAKVYRTQMDELDHSFIGWQMAMHTQCFLNLRGETDDVLALHGEAFSEADAMAFRKADKVFDGTFKLWQSVVWTYYGEFEKCAKLALEYGVDWLAKRLPSSITTFPEAFCMGVSCFAAARRRNQPRQRRKLGKLAKQVHKNVKRWIEQGCPNLSHLDALLDAERAAFEGRMFVAKQKYEGAIVIAARSGQLLNAGLAAERLGEYLLEMQEPKDDVWFHLDRSVQYYREVGANGVANRLEQKYINLRPLPEQVVAPTVVVLEA